MAGPNEEPYAEQPVTLQFKEKVGRFIVSVKTLRGDPHYIAMGIGIGVFVGMTPTFPFHTLLAVALALALKASKPAAALAAWVGNPLTIPAFYWASYRIGVLIVGDAAPFNEELVTIAQHMKLGMDVTLAMMIGGIVLGIAPGVVSYFVARRILAAIRSRRRKRSA